MNTTLNFAKKAALSLTVLVSLGLAQPAAAIDANNGKLKYGLQWFVATTDGKGKAYDAVSNEWNALSLNKSIYDPTKPTMIYFHGWQPGAKGKREDFVWPRKDGNIDTLKEWKAAGWNVGIFDWSQFADDGDVFDGAAGIWVSQAEAKIWSRYRPTTGLRYKYKDPVSGKYVYSGVSPSAFALNLPQWTGVADRWGDDTRGADIDEAIQFIAGLDPKTNTPITRQRITDAYKPEFSCKQFVQAVACDLFPKDSSGYAPLCHADAPMWEEFFVDKVCDKPSVGDIAVLNIMRAMPTQTGVVRFSGHSLGHQLATRTAAHLWAGYHHSKSPGFKRVLPLSVDLLDPYASSGKKDYLKRGFTAWEGNNGPFVNPSSDPFYKEEGTTADRVFHYHEMMRTFASANKFPRYGVTYYMSTALARVTGSTHNPRLMHRVPSQRLFFDYMGTADLGGRHNGAKFWYFDTYNLVPPTVGPSIFGGKLFPYALFPGAVEDTQYMADMRTNDIHFSLTEGRSTPTTDDDGFKVCQKNAATLNKLIVDYSCP
jgi:hypothetical protein